MQSAKENILSEIAQQAGLIAISFYERRNELLIEQKGEGDFVSQADRAVEKFIRSQLQAHFPDTAILGEEGGGEEHETMFVVDPIDGTANFLRGSPLWGVSIAFVHKLKPQFGVLHFPCLSKTLSATAGQGLRLNGQSFERACPSENFDLIAVGDSNCWPRESVNQLRNAINNPNTAQHAYRCASIGMGFTALGAVDCYVEKYTNLWDVAAGLLICEEAELTSHYSLSAQPNNCHLVVGTASAVQVVIDYESSHAVEFSLAS